MTDKIVYSNGVKKLLADLSQFAKLSIDPNKELNFVLNCDQNIIGILKETKSKNQIIEDQYNELRPVVSQPGVCYVQVKVHKKKLLTNRRSVSYTYLGKQ